MDLFPAGQLKNNSSRVLKKNVSANTSLGKDKSVDGIWLGRAQVRCPIRGRAIPYDRRPTSVLAGWFSRENDIALVPFSGCPLDAYTRQACVNLPASDSAVRVGANGTRVDISGYGKKSFDSDPGSLSALHQVTVDLVDARTCKIFRFSTQNNICGGDSGGPMVGTT